MRMIARSLSFLLMAAAIAAAARDAIESLLAKDVRMASLDELWSLLGGAGLATLRSLSPWLTDHVIDEALTWTGWIVLACLGCALFLMSRPRDGRGRPTLRRSAGKA